MSLARLENCKETRINGISLKNVGDCAVLIEFDRSIVVEGVEGCAVEINSAGAYCKKCGFMAGGSTRVTLKKTGP